MAEDPKNTGKGNLLMIFGEPDKVLETTLKAEINEDAWATLNSDTSRPFAKPKSGRIAAKVIDHLGDEVMTVCRVSCARRESLERT